MKHLLLTLAVLLSGCVRLGIEATATDHHEYDLPNTPSVNVMVPVTVSGALGSSIAKALESAGKPKSSHIDSVDLSAVITAARLGTDTSLAGVYSCKIELASDTASLTISDHQLSDGDRKQASIELPLDHATLDELRPLANGSHPRVTTTFTVNPSELTAHEASIDLVVDASADVQASL
jgi:hypothetical protein